MIIRFISHVFPLVSRELDYWSSKAEQIPDGIRVRPLPVSRPKSFTPRRIVYALYRKTIYRELSGSLSPSRPSAISDNFAPPVMMESPFSVNLA